MGEIRTIPRASYAARPVNDPPELHAAAARLGRLVGRGLLGFSEAYGAVMGECARKYDGLLGGDIETRLARTMADAASAWELTACAEIHAAVRDAIAQRRTRDEILAAAYVANRQRLERQDVDAIVREDVSHAIVRIKAARAAGAKNAR